MGRLLRIAIYAILILGLYFWVINMYKGSDPVVPPKTNVDTTTVDSLDPVLDSIVENTTDLVSDQDVVDGTIDYNEVDKTVEEIKVKKQNEVPQVSVPVVKPTEKSAPKTSKPTASTKPSTVPQAKLDKPLPTPKPIKTEAEPGGSYKVIAGSYLLKENALKMVKKLKSLGYDDAKTAIFNNSEFHSVVATTFGSEADAKKEVAKLKRQGIDCLVKK